MSQYYQPLEENSFRLLSFSDRSGLSCSLQAYKLDQAPQYIALSYTWGRSSYQTGRSELLTYSITLNGEYYEVQQNLHDALKHLGRRVKEEQCLFWVDAICINQADFEERNAQVKQMKDIYKRAGKIYAWLGLPFDEKETRLAVSLMRSFNVYLSEGLQKYDNDISAVLALVTQSHVGFPCNADSELWMAWDGIAEIFNQSYWQRVWIYQEATTPGQIEFFCGNHTFDDILLSATVSFALTFSKSPGFPTRFIKAAGHSSSVASLSTARIRRGEGKSRRLLDLMVEVRKARCTNPRDKVYAPLGHASDVTPDQIDVEYSKSIVEVYIDAVRSALFHPNLQGLEILGLVFTPASDTSNESLSEIFEPPMPSWVPDWRQRVSISRFADSSKTTENGLPLYSPCPGTLEACICGAELEIKGRLIDNLCIYTLTNGSSLTPRSWYDTLLASDRKTADASEAIRRSLVGDRCHTVHGIKTNDILRTWKRGGMVDWTLLDSDRDQLDPHPLEKLDNMFNDMMNVCYGKRMCKLMEGSFAVVPAAARTGDQVVAFYGGNSLYLVRRLPNREDAFKFIGECYVDGWMDGAIFDAFEQADKPIQTLILV